MHPLTLVHSSLICQMLCINFEINNTFEFVFAYAFASSFEFECIWVWILDLPDPTSQEPRHTQSQI